VSEGVLSTGLVRYGVAPDHPETKNVITEFEQVNLFVADTLQPRKLSNQTKSKQNPKNKLDTFLVT
jgi:hypothetical protein